MPRVMQVPGPTPDHDPERRRADDERWTEEERAEWRATGQYDTTEERDDDRD